MNMRQEEWNTAGDIASFKEGMTRVEINCRPVVIAKVEGEFFAYSNLCPHSGGPMNRGELNGCVVTCPLHGWRFDLKQQGQETHGYRPLRMYPTREEGGNLLVLV